MATSEKPLAYIAFTNGFFKRLRKKYQTVESVLES